MAALPPTRSRKPFVVIAIVAVIGAVIVASQSGGGGATSEKRVARSERGVRAPAPGVVFRDGTWQKPVPGRRLPHRVSPPADGLVRVSGAVVDAATGKPVPDVEVVFADGQSESTTQSDMAGRYSIDVHPGHYRPFVRAAGIISVGEPPRDRLPRRPSSGEVAASRLEVAPDLAVFTNLAGADLEVVRAGVIAGRVFDRDGRPIAGALVRAMPSDGQLLRPVLGTDVAETDLDGTFRLELGAASYVVEAFHDRYGATESAPTVNLVAGDTATTDLTMVAGCVVTGRIVRADGNEPGDGAIERAWSSHDSGYYPSGTFEDDGEFRWSSRDEGDVTLRAWPWKAPPSPSRTFACRDGARFDDVVFTVPSTRADLGGTILTAGGAPAARAFIDITGMSDGTMNQQERADDQGRWDVFALPPGTYQITAYVEGEGAVSAVVTSPGSGNTLRLSGRGTLVGRATGLTDGSFSLTVNTCETAHAVLHPRSKHMVTVQNGSYRVDGLPACAMRGEVSNHARARPFETTITAGGVTTLDLDLSPPRPKTITGTVRDEDGNAVAGANLAVLTSDLHDASSATTDASGRFSITAHGGDILIIGAPVGTAELVVSDADPDTKHVEITLTPGDW
jgi:hypothetical protein